MIVLISFRETTLPLIDFPITILKYHHLKYLSSPNIEKKENLTKIKRADSTALCAHNMVSAVNRDNGASNAVRKIAA